MIKTKTKNHKISKYRNQVKQERKKKKLYKIKINQIRL